jgi:glycosyltransferase involved in cell wall biosynthesis
MPSVTQITNSLSGSVSSGGVEIVVRVWQKAFNKLNLNSYVLAMCDRNDLPSEYGKNDFRLIKCKSNQKNPWLRFNIRALTEIYRAVSESDLLLIHFCKDIFTNSAALLAILKRKNFAIQSHGMINLDREGILTRYYLIFVLRRANMIFSLTKKESDNFSKRHLHNICEISNPIEFSDVSDVTRKKVILFIGRFHERKRPEMAIEAMTEVIKNHPDYLLLMYGPESSYKEEMKLLVKNKNMENYVQIREAISNYDAKVLLSESSVFLLPSFDEIFPMAMIEAMLYKCPVICGTDNGLYEKIKDFNLVLTADTASQLSLQIQNVLSSAEIRSKMIENSFFWVTQNCNSINLATKILQILDKH